MTKNIKRLLLFAVMMFLTTQAFAEYKPAKIYIYGFSASFNDSTVYFTDIMEVDSAWLEAKHGFLYSRENYSAQLKNYLVDKGVVTPTCIVSFAKSKKQVEKKFAKLKKKYVGTKKHYLVNYIPEVEFHFDAVDASQDGVAMHKETKEEKKARKAAEKEKKKKEKNKNRRGAIKRPEGMPPGGGPGKGGPGAGGPGGAPGGAPGGMM